MPTTTIKKFRIAVGQMGDELRKMEIGETVRFPFDKYNYNSVRSAPASLWAERSKGMQWRTRANYDEGCTEVTRIS